MSRHATRIGEREIVVGWDHPLLTYFGMEYDLSATDPDTQPRVWVGTDLRELYELDDLRRAMRKVEGARAFIDSIGATLYGDKDEGR